MISIVEAESKYIEAKSEARSDKTGRVYSNALNVVNSLLATHDLKPEDPIDKLPVDIISTFCKESIERGYSIKTEKIYLTAISQFFHFLAGEEISSPNLARVDWLMKHKSRRFHERIPQFNREYIEKILSYVETLTAGPVHDEQDRLRKYRDRAFIYTLADTGLRVHEACKLLKSDIDWNEGRAFVIGKGGDEAAVRFSPRSLQALKDYIAQRAKFDGASGKPLSSLPLFVRHDLGSKKHIEAITTATGRNIVEDLIKSCLGPEMLGEVTPHSFRHYFVTCVLQQSGNLKLAQELARHKNIGMTSRYSHLTDSEIDKGYWDAIVKPHF